MLCLKLKKLVPEILLLWIKVWLGLLLTLFTPTRALHSCISCLVLLRLSGPCCNPWAIAGVGKTKITWHILRHIWLLDYLLLGLLMLVNYLSLRSVRLSIRSFSFSFIWMNRPISFFKLMLNYFALTILEYFDGHLLLAWRYYGLFYSHWTDVCLDKRLLLLICEHRRWCRLFVDFLWCGKVLLLPF